MSAKVEQITQPMLLGEGPHWDAGQQCLYYVDIFNHHIYKYVPSSGIVTKTKLSDSVGFVIPISGTTDQFVIGSLRKVLVIQWNGEDGSEVKILSVVAEVDKEKPDNTLNDGKADQKGRLFSGSMGKLISPGKFEPNEGSFFSFNKSGAQLKLKDIHLSNGMCWDLNKKIMYYIDSFDYFVRAYDYDYSTGDMTNQRVAFDFKTNNTEGLPDGMTIDTDGNLWIACFGGSQIIQVDPTNGTVLQNVPIPALQVTSVAFGGKNLDELYVTSASMNIKSEQKPPCGAVFKVTGTNAKGYPGDACILK